VSCERHDQNVLVYYEELFQQSNLYKTQIVCLVWKIYYAQNNNSATISRLKEMTH